MLTYCFVTGARDHVEIPYAASAENLSTHDEQTTRTDMSMDYHTEATDMSDQQYGDDQRADANSTPQPPTIHMRYDSFEAAREHYLEYSLRKGFSVRIDWSRKDANKEYLKAFLACTKEIGRAHV